MDNNRENGGIYYTRRQDFDRVVRKRNANGRVIREKSADAAEEDTDGARRSSATRRVFGGRTRAKGSSKHRRTANGSEFKQAAVPHTPRDKFEMKRKISRDTILKVRCAVLFALCSAVAAMLVLMTPIFNIESIHLDGNKVVTKSMIQEKVGDYIGRNIFSVSLKEVENRILEIPQISEVHVKKSFISPSLTLELTESMPSAYLLYGNSIVVINSDLRIIDDSSSFDTDSIPSLSGVSIGSYKLNETLETDSPEKTEILRTLLKTLENLGMINDISYIAVDDLTNITFNYENRIEVQCGSQYELERKIRMFAQAVRSSSIDEGAMGTMDVSVPGKAIYTP